jgi:nucleoside-diphosphate-sugar epimerase
MTHFLVTGGAGFIGSHIAEFLIQSGHEVTVVDNLSTGFIDNLATIMPSIHFVQDDIRNIDRISKALIGVDFVLHQAALPSVPRSIQDPVSSNFHNVDGTLALLVAARDAGVKRFIFASSSSVYGSDPTIPKRETQPTIPKSPYALTKLTGEHYCRLFYEIYGFETVSLRYFNVFGPRQNPNSQYSAVIPLFIRNMLHNDQSVIFSNGEQSRDFTYVSNVVAANLSACTALEVPGKVFNIGCNQKTSVNNLFSKIAALLDYSGNPVYKPLRPGDVRDSLADISAAVEMLRYRPFVELDEGLHKTVNYYRKAFG